MSDEILVDYLPVNETKLRTKEYDKECESFAEKV